MERNRSVRISSQNPTGSRSAWWLSLLITLLILWLATGLRFYQIGEQSLWNDEGNSARLSERSPALIIEGTASDIHPPLYYLMLRGWRELLGENEFSLRSFSAFAGILTVAASLALASLLLGQAAPKKKAVIFALVTAFLAAVNPALIYYSRETRMYAMLAFLSALSTLILIRWLGAGRRRIHWGLFYIIVATAGLYTHYFFPVVLLLQNLIVVLWSLRYFTEILFAPFRLENHFSLRKTIVSWVGMMVFVFLLYSPWIPIFLRQAGGRPGQQEPFWNFVWDGVRWLTFGETIAVDELIWPTAAVFILCIGVIIAARGQSIIPLLGTTLPMLSMYATGATSPAFFKFMLIAVPFFVILLSKAVDNSIWGKKNRWWLILPAVLFLPVLWGTAVSLSNLYNNPAYARADYRGMAARISAEAHPNAGIILNAPNQWEVFTYYHRQGAPVYPLPKGQADPAILEPQLAAIAADHDRLYAIYWGDQQRDPHHVVERWLDENTFKASEEWVGDVRFVVYAVPNEALEKTDTAIDLQFENGITLSGYTLPSSQFKPGDIVQITLAWKTEQPIMERYKVFLHLIDADGNLVAQRDSEPGGGQAITTEWQVGEEIIDNHGILIPSELRPGMYTLVMGLYASDDPSRRLLIIGDKLQSHSATEAENLDSWVLGSITVN